LKQLEPRREPLLACSSGVSCHWLLLYIRGMRPGTAGARPGSRRRGPHAHRCRWSCLPKRCARIAWGEIRRPAA
jgi:hypothetical protein